VYYIKIRNTVEQKVHSVLSDKKMLLKLALLSLIESIRSNPGKYTSLIYHNNTRSNADCISQCYDTASYTHGQQEQHPSQDYISMLIEEAEKLYNKLVKELVDEVSRIILLIYYHHCHYCRLKDNALAGSQMCIVTGPRIDLAIALIDRMPSYMVYYH